MDRTRHELFEQVWQTPMTHLAAQFNISGSSLKELCKKHEIPLPARGHWTKVELGRGDARPELPYPEHNPSIQFSDASQTRLGHEKVRRKKREPRRRSKTDAHALMSSTGHLHDLRCIKTAESIKARIYALEMRTHQSFAAADRVEWPPTTLFAFSYFNSKQEEIPIVATARHALRAVLLADQIIKRLGSQGIDVALEAKRDQVRYRMIAQKQGEQYEIDFRETWTKAAKTPTLIKLFRLDTGRDPWRDYIEVPKNILCVNLGGKYGHAFRDGRSSLEEQLDKITEHIVGKLDGKIAWREECAIRKREFERRKAIREHNNRISSDQKQQLEAAIKESEQFDQFQRLEEYLLRLAAAVERLPADQNKIGRVWLNLVKSQADAKNPLARRLRAFSAIDRLGAAESGHYWYGELLP